MSALSLSFCGYKRFLIKGEDYKEDLNIHRLIKENFSKTKEELYQEIERASRVRRGSKIALRRRKEKIFAINSEQIRQNTTMIEQVLKIQKLI